MSSKSINGVFHREGLLLGAANFPLHQSTRVDCSSFLLKHVRNAMKNSTIQAPLGQQKRKQLNQMISEYTQPISTESGSMLPHYESGSNCCSAEMQWFCHFLFTPENISQPDL